MIGRIFMKGAAVRLWKGALSKGGGGQNHKGGISRWRHLNMWLWLGLESLRLFDDVPSSVRGRWGEKGPLPCLSSRITWSIKPRLPRRLCGPFVEGVPVPLGYLILSQHNKLPGPGTAFLAIWLSFRTSSNKLKLVFCPSFQSRYLYLQGTTVSELFSITTEVFTTGMTLIWSTRTYNIISEGNSWL